MLMNVSLLILHFVIRKIKIKKEILQLKKYISDDNLKHLNNIILVLDRAYYSFDFINFLDTHNFNYVIRIKNNCTLIKNNKLTKNKIIKHQNIRIITYKETINFS